MAFDATELKNQLGDFFEHPLCGMLITEPGGKIIHANQCMANWMGSTPEELINRRFSDLLTMGGKIYYETHLWPLLRMQGYFDEVAVELNSKSGEKKQVLINAFERRNKDDQPFFVQITVFKAADRRQYEQNLKEEKSRIENTLKNEKLISAMKEQFIAVLGHDLRNPLSSILTGTSILLEEPDLEPHKPVLSIISRSAERMSELINNIMDFARVRMGSGINICRKSTDLAPILQHVIDEIAISWPKAIIKRELNINRQVDCDGPRIAQLCSNLLANAITHGFSGTPVVVRAVTNLNLFELTITNHGKPIPSSAIDKIFQPFTREDHRPSQQGLGLGLFIASEIAKAHTGELSVHSDESETSFTFRMDNPL